MLNPEATSGVGIDCSPILEKLEAEYVRTGSPVTVNFRSLAPFSSGTDRHTHLLHPYPAKLLLNIPFFFLRCRTIAPEACTVLDPFAGSGTVLLEAILSGRTAVGADANPLARMICHAKTHPLCPKTLDETLRRILNLARMSARTPPPDVINIHYWFTDSVIEKLNDLVCAIKKIECINLQTFFQVCFSACVRRVSLADPRLSVPVKINPERAHIYGAKGDAAIRRLQAAETADVLRVFKTISEQNISRMTRLWSSIPSNVSSVRISTDARKLGISDAECDLVITSPPYAGAQKYIRSSSLSLGWLGLAGARDLRSLEQSNIGREHYPKHEYSTEANCAAPAANELLSEIRHKNPLRAHIASNYLSEMDAALAEITRVVRPGGFVVIVMGANLILGKAFNTPMYIEQIANKNGLTTSMHLVDEIRSRGLMTKRNKTASIIPTESVLVMRKS